MNYFNDSESGRSDEKIGLKHIAFLVVLLIALLAPAGWMFYSAHQEQIKQEGFKKAQEEQRKAVAALMQDWPRRPEGKERKMAVKIARGTTGQAELSSQSCDVDIYEEDWAILPPSGPSATSEDPMGWNVTPGGVVTVPIGAPIGAYTAKYYDKASGACTEPPLIVEVFQYNFTVPCVKIDLTATRVS